MRDHPEGRTPWWETILMRWDHPHEMRDHPDERPPWRKTIRWQTSLTRDHPEERPPWWETTLTLMRDYPGERSLRWETTRMRDHPDERPPWRMITLRRDHPDERDHLSFKTIFSGTLPFHLRVNESIIEDHPSFKISFFCSTVRLAIREVFHHTCLVNERNNLLPAIVFSQLSCIQRVLQNITM